jgi:hypothetical protein
VSTDIKNLSDSGTDQNKKTTDQSRDITTGHKKFEISLDFFLQFGLSGMIGSATGLQAVFAAEV